MTTLKSKLQEDLNAAIKERNELRSSTLRLTLTAITKEEVAGKEKRQLSDEEVTKVITREAKKRREAADAFAQGGRPSRRAGEGGGRAAGHVPAQADVRRRAAADRRPGRRGGEGGRGRGPARHGQVMKIVNPKVAGQAEGGRVAAVVKQLLAGG